MAEPDLKKELTETLSGLGTTFAVTYKCSAIDGVNMARDIVEQAMLVADEMLLERQATPSSDQRNSRGMFPGDEAVLKASLNKNRSGLGR